MYTFVFLWTPALSPSGEDIPHGFIFATYMVSCMAGSSIASMLLSKNNFRPESYMQVRPVGVRELGAWRGESESAHIRPPTPPLLEGICFVFVFFFPLSSR